MMNWTKLLYSRCLNWKDLNQYVCDLKSPYSTKQIKGVKILNESFNWAFDSLIKDELPKASSLINDYKSWQWNPPANRSEKAFIYKAYLGTVVDLHLYVTNIIKLTSESLPILCDDKDPDINKAANQLKEKIELFNFLIENSGLNNQIEEVKNYWIRIF